ncbi:unnamed protein product [Lampetra fluviatilis]
MHSSPSSGRSDGRGDGGGGGHQSPQGVARSSDADVNEGPGAVHISCQLPALATRWDARLSALIVTRLAA